MNSNFVRSIMFAAAVLASGAIGNAQSPAGLAADVGFNFRFMSKDLPAGEYVITRLAAFANPTFKLANVATGEAVLMVARSQETAKRQDLPPRLVFKCDSVTCGLSQIWMGGADPGYVLPKPKLTPAEQERVAVVVLKTNTSKAD